MTVSDHAQLMEQFAALRKSLTRARENESKLRVRENLAWAMGDLQRVRSYVLDCTPDDRE